MPPQIQEFWASPSAQEHILGKHGVTLEEALEAAESSPVYQPASSHPTGAPRPTGEKRYLIAGKTESGRRLWVVFADEGKRRGRIITAREPQGRAERARHKRMRGD
jgi:uncharacterized DUF497 family protein